MATRPQASRPQASSFMALLLFTVSSALQASPDNSTHVRLFASYPSSIPPPHLTFVSYVLHIYGSICKGTMGWDRNRRWIQKRSKIPSMMNDTDLSTHKEFNWAYTEKLEAVYKDIEEHARALDSALYPVSVRIPLSPNKNPHQLVSAGPCYLRPPSSKVKLRNTDPAINDSDTSTQPQHRVHLQRSWPTLNIVSFPRFART